MKKNLFLAVLLASAGSMAALLQPTVPAPGGESACRITAGVYSNVKKFGDSRGAEDLMGGLNFTHYTAYDFFYGVGVAFGGITGVPTGPVQSASKGLFTETGKADTDLRIQGEFSLGFMPELAERVHAGIVTSVGYGYNFNKTKNEAAKALGVTFGTLNWKVGLGLSFGFTDSFALYLTPSYVMSDIMFFKAGTPDLVRASANNSGMEIPLGLVFGLTDEVSMYVETTTKFKKFENWSQNHKQEFALGFSYTM